MIYLDNAATSLIKPDDVIWAVTDALRTLGNSARGVHKASLDATRMVYRTREVLADFFHCPHPEQVIFMSNATEALNTAIFGRFAPGDHVITTVLEHNSVLRPLYLLEKSGVEVSFLECDGTGNINAADIEPLIKQNTRGIICTHASNVTGNRVDVKAVGQIARAYDLIFIVDASQTAGVMSIDMTAMGIDVLCFTGHKALMGPQGTGGLCINGKLKIRPLKVGGSGSWTYLREQPEAYPEGLEAGTINSHGIAGLAAGIAYIQKTGMEAIYAHEIALAKMFYEGVMTLAGVKVYGDFNSWRRAPIVSLNLRDYDSSMISDILDAEYHIATRPGAHCAPRLHEALGTVSQGAVRFSFGCFNTKKDVKAAIQAIRELADNDLTEDRG